MNTKGLTPIKAVLAPTLIGAIFVAGVNWYDESNADSTPRMQPSSAFACTQEAKRCPDGAYVGKVGPNCEFAPCPNAKSAQGGTQLPRPPAVENGLDQERNTIRELQRQWETVSRKVPFSPTTTNKLWVLDAIQFIGTGRMLIQFEDGHEVHAAAMDYDDGLFKILKVFKSRSPFVLGDWQNIVKEYGTKEHQITTYLYDSVSGGYTRSSENIFIRRRAR